MPVNEKEFNGILFDQLTILEDTGEVAEQENATRILAVIAKKRGQIMRKLYQNPPASKQE